MSCRLVVLSGVVLPLIGVGPNRHAQFSGFGHLGFYVDWEEGRHAFFAIEERDFLVNASLKDKISFISEYIIRFNSNSATNFLPSIERSLEKFSCTNNYSIIVGKLHSLITYWNDNYHHGRVFFSVIIRPMGFSYFVPLHTLGLQFQWQNLGKLGFRYDFMVGNGISLTDAFHDSGVPSLLVSVYIKPREGIRIGASYYWNNLQDNTPGLNSGHSTAATIPDELRCNGPIKFRLSSLSFAHFGEKFEILSETGYHVADTDSIGRVVNFFQCVYAGANLTGRSTSYFITDLVDVADNDLHIYSIEELIIAFGYWYSFNYLLNIKVQLEKCWAYKHYGHSQKTSYGGPFLKVQRAYGF